MNAKISLAKIIVLVTCLAAAQAQAVVGTAVVRAVRGTATYAEGTNAPVPLRVGKILKPGAKVKTEAQSQVDLYLDQNGPVVRITEKSTLGLDKMDFNETGTETVIATQLNLTEGRILGSVKKLAAASKYVVFVLVGRMEIRGSDYDISANGLVRMTSGSAVLYRSRPGQPDSEEVINAGQSFNPAATTNGVPPKVIPIPPKELQELRREVNSGFIPFCPGAPNPPGWDSPFPRPLPQRAF